MLTVNHAMELQDTSETLALAGQLLLQLPQLTVPFSLHTHLVMASLHFIDAFCACADQRWQDIQVHPLPGMLHTQVMSAQPAYQNACQCCIYWVLQKGWNSQAGQHT